MVAKIKQEDCFFKKWLSVHSSFVVAAQSAILKLLYKALGQTWSISQPLPVLVPSRFRDRALLRFLL
jgi:hypothetical protein